ncbi:predicted protein [Streptomyces filamentosus NRRL 15998]|uniref:Predicted protein n=1 Tax=Streptomyces filamentosus NRRL 15998 TaxID=457431 RepID=D6AUZ0_STRFL|nr:predicted protein [Streptomyces filamentosus NRRL 15998]
MAAEAEAADGLEPFARRGRESGGRTPSRPLSRVRGVFRVFGGVGGPYGRNSLTVSIAIIHMGCPPVPKAAARA